jgi:hypothetical protein
MFALPSLQRDYVLCSQYDDALDLPAIPDLAPDASADDTAAVAALVADRDQKLKVARERGGDEWVKLTKPGKVPSRFTFRQVPRHSVNWLYGEVERRQLSHIETLELLFRLALKSVDGLGSYEVRRDGGEHDLLSLDSLDTLYGIGAGLGVKVVIELASIIALRTTRGGAGPLS